MGRNYSAVPFEYLEEMEELTDEEFGRLIRGLLRFSMTGEIPTALGNEKFFIHRIVNREMALQASYENLSQVRSEAGKLGAQRRWNGKMAKDGNDKANVKDKDKDKDKYKVNPSPPGVYGRAGGESMGRDVLELKNWMETVDFAGFGERKEGCL